ncbi:hypothetical protein ED312_05760 [Sinomicrobium pectinilyticum]|uniref:Uncharacterized protein n=1 Tax=Sinomicrobium pectinilyticum TaxID=1084421 RepID=A0A3N0ESC9_SINP1|nr:hypothetical protein ED312_05760 [Sinomicrobium pectinilyticum]
MYKDKITPGNLLSKRKSVKSPNISVIMKKDLSERDCFLSGRDYFCFLRYLIKKTAGSGSK